MTTYTVVNGTQAQITPTAGVTVDALSYKDAITLTNTEVATLLATAGVAVMKSGPSRALKRIIFGRGAGRPTMSYSATVNADKPIAYYRLAEASGSSVYDASGHARTATLWGAVARYTQAVSGLITNDSNAAIKFDAGTRAGTTPGTDDAGIDLPLGIPSAFGAGGAHSLEAWVEVDHLSWVFQGMILDAGGGIGGLLTNAPGQSDDASADAAYASANFTFVVFDSDGVQGELDAPTFATSPIGARFHLVGTFDGVDTMRIYVNGALVASDSFHAFAGVAYSGAGFAYDANGYPFAIGNVSQAFEAQNFAPGGAGSNEWAGTIDEVAIYPSALSATRVLAHYNAGK